MVIDWTLNLGNLITLAGMLASGAWFVASLSSRLRAVEASVKKVGEVLVALAHGEERMKALDQRIDDLPCRRPSDKCPR